MKYPPWLPILLGFLTAVGPVSIDMYLPAFPVIAVALGNVSGAAQITLAAFFIGLAAGQMTQGPLSDRLGRRVPLIGGMILYTLASIGCALAPGLLSFSLLRALAAFGGSAGMVVPRAIVRDLADGHAAAKLLSQLMLVMGAAPILAPTLGGLILGVAGWHAIFWVAALYGVACTVLVWALLPDTLPVQRRVRIGLGGILSRYAQIGTERSFITHAATCVFGTAAMFCYISGAAPVFIERYHVSPVVFGMLFGVNASAYIVASQINARLLPRFGAGRVLSAAVRVLVAATLVLTVNAASGWGGVVGLMLPLTASLGSLGFVLPTATVGALSRHSAHAGSASALMGTMQFTLGAIMGSLVGVASDGTARPMAILMLVCALGAAAADLCRPREPGGMVRVPA